MGGRIMTVWVLVLILVNPVYGFSTVYDIPKPGTSYWYDTFDLCIGEQESVRKELSESFPYATDFMIKCQKRTIPPLKPAAASTQVNYNTLITHWVGSRHPGEAFKIKVDMIRVLHNADGTKSNILAFQVFAYFEDTSESYVLFIKNDEVTAWVGIGEAPYEEETEDVGEFVRPEKETA